MAAPLGSAAEGKLEAKKETVESGFICRPPLIPHSFYLLNLYIYSPPQTHSSFLLHDPAAHKYSPDDAAGGGNWTHQARVCVCVCSNVKPLNTFYSEFFRTQHMIYIMTIKIMLSFSWF